MTEHLLDCMSAYPGLFTFILSYHFLGSPVLVIFPPAVREVSNLIILTRLWWSIRDMTFLLCC